MRGQMTAPETNPTTQVLICLLVGGPFDGTESEYFTSTQSIRMRAGPGDHFAIYRRPNPDQLADDGRTIFHFDVLVEEPAT